MLKEERQQKILNILNTERKVIAKDLSNRLHVSEDTIRRDLNDLSRQKKLKRVHSGALRIGPPVTSFTYRTNVNNEVKTKIARKTLPLLKEDSVILIDGSTTNLMLVKLLPADFGATIITNSPPIAIELVNFPNIEVINLGGDFYKRSMINLGLQTYKQLQQLRADTYVMGIYNLNISDGISVPTIQEAEIKRQMFDISNEVIGMVTSDKFNTMSNALVGDITDLNYLVSDHLAPAIKQAYQQLNINLID